MTGRSLILQGVLATGGLAIAYATWQRPPERAVGEVIVVDATKSELGVVHFEDDNTSLDVQRGSSDGDNGIWLNLLDKTPIAKPPTKVPSGKTPAPATATKPRPMRSLRGDEPAEKLLEQFAPLRSARAFGSLDAAKLKELGLDAAKKKLSVQARGQSHDFVIGAPAQGSGENYLRDTKSGQVFLMPRTLLSDLQGAAFRLVDRKLHTFKIPDVGRLKVTTGGKSKELVIIDRKNANTYKMAPASTPDKPDEFARNWHEKIWRLFPTEVLGKAEVPVAGSPKVVVRVDYFDGTKSVGWVEIAKVDVAPAEDATSSDGKAADAPKPPQNPTEMYARTEHTAGWIRLNNDPSVVADTEKLISGS